MKNQLKKTSYLSLFLFNVLFGLSACGITSDVIHQKSNDKRLLKPGALDVPINEIYTKYQYNFLDQYKITHDFIMTGGCSYRSTKTVGIHDLVPGTNYAISNAPDIFEKDEHTFVRVYPFKDHAYKNPINIDKYTRPEWTADGRTWKGFEPICAQAWQLSNHSLSISLVKLPVDAAIKRYSVANLALQKKTIGTNTWLTQTAELEPRVINTFGGEFMVAILPIENTGYVFVFKLKANQDSLQHPQAHTQIQAIFRHLLESVKIEPIKP